MPCITLLIGGGRKDFSTPGNKPASGRPLTCQILSFHQWTPCLDGPFLILHSPLLKNCLFVLQTCLWFYRLPSPDCRFFSFRKLIKLCVVLAALGLLCCPRAFSGSARASRCSGFACCRPRALGHRLSSCGVWASLPRGTWNLCRPGIKPMSPALGSRFLTTGPPGKSPKL